MRLDISRLKDIAMAICDKYMENNGKYLETEKDNFWFIEMEQAIDLQKEPDSWCVGSLEDDYFDLEEIVLKGREVNILDLDRFYILFKILFYQIQKTKYKF